MTLERDLARLGELGTDLEELPVVAPMDSDPESEPVREPRRRGRTMGKGNGKSKAANERAALIRRRAAVLGG